MQAHSVLPGRLCCNPALTYAHTYHTVRDGRVGAFKLRLAVLLRAESTHIYIDTSFLMSMTKIGSNSRQELIRWLQHNCTDPIHVPIWAAHEYLKQQVAGTIVTELAKKTNEISDLVGRTYFRPFIDEQFREGAEDTPTIRTETRAALSVVGRMAATSREWKK